ncbi:unnamed protein product [Ectocarpus sp. CCAP 1310/34]|nr:unnamed protein product [Ectocarpus sp. CCAP 1310/34]
MPAPCRRKPGLELYDALLLRLPTGLWRSCLPPPPAASSSLADYFISRTSHAGKGGDRLLDKVGP